MSIFRLKLLNRDNLYSIVLVYLLLFFVGCLVASEYSLRFPESEIAAFFQFLLSGVWALFFLYIAEILRTFGYSRKLVIILRYCLVMGALFGFSLGNPMLSLYKLETVEYVFVLFHFMTLTLTFVIMTVILSGIFRSEETHHDHIWGAIVAYFLAILVFADVYEILSLLDPGLLGIHVERGMPNFIECILYSINSMTGLDALYPNASSLFQKISNIENLLGNLFLIVVLGRLLSHPLRK